jgi:7-carboxy-7-deazaguanine synthase
MNAKQIQVNEFYGTIQGEGSSAGRLCVMLRLAHCNLNCNFCDSPYAWNFGEDGSFKHGLKTYQRANEVKVMEVDALAKKIDSIGAPLLVVTGGEPMIQQSSLVPLFEKLEKIERIEIETNGTISPIKSFDPYVDQYNVSPKLANSGNEKERRYQPSVLQSMATKAIFKFVYGGEGNDAEINEIVGKNSIHPSRVWIMPLGKTRTEISETRDLAVHFAQRNGYNYSPRIHIDIWDNKRAV